MKIYLPENLDLESVIIDYEEKYKEKYQWIIHTIVSQKYKVKPGIGDYVNLDQVTLRKFLGERYCKDILKQLESSGIIKINSKYSANKFCMSYKLTEKYGSSGVKSVDFTGDKAIRYIYKLNDFDEKRLAEQLKNPAVAQLFKNVYKIDIDKQGALTYAAKSYNKGEINIEQYISAFVSIENISNKDENYFFTVDEKTGRVYHSIANCPRYLRQFLSYEGEQLFQIDIANSQPMLFYSLILDFLENRKSINEHILSNNTNDTYLSTTLSPYVETISDNELPADVIRYKEKTSTGLFYEDLMIEFGIPINTESRIAFKTNFFGTIFFSKVHGSWEYPESKKFKVVYPTVIDAVIWHKRFSHADLALKLQKVESDIVIKGVCGRIVEENNADSVPFFCTVHDCIVCLNKDVDYIKGLLEGELKAVMGFVPMVKTSAFAKN